MYHNDANIKLNFGNGNIIVTGTINALIFKKIDKTLVIGEQMNASNYSTDYSILDIYSIPFYNFSEIQQFKKLLLDSYESHSFIFKNIQFDFSNYTRKSVDCILDQLAWIEHFIPRAQVV